MTDGLVLISGSANCRNMALDNRRDATHSWPKVIRAIDALGVRRRKSPQETSALVTVQGEANSSSPLASDLVGWPSIPVAGKQVKMKSVKACRIFARENEDQGAGDKLQRCPR